MGILTSLTEAFSGPNAKTAFLTAAGTGLTAAGGVGMAHGETTLSSQFLALGTAMLTTAFKMHNGQQEQPQAAPVTVNVYNDDNDDLRI